MQVLLMYRDRDFDPRRKLPHEQLLAHSAPGDVPLDPMTSRAAQNELALIQDLELDTLFNAMALGDKFLLQVIKRAILAGESDLDTIRYRQAILADCLRNPDVVRELYHIPIEAIENKQRHWLGIFSRYPTGILSGAIEMMQMFVGLLKKLRAIADEHAAKFESEGFGRFFAMIKKELDDEYLAVVQNHLAELRFRGGVLISAELGPGNEGAHYVLRRPHKPGHWTRRIFDKSPVYTFRLHPRDEHGARALGELKDRGINLVANALAQSADHIDSFFTLLRAELAFYIGCLNLYEQLEQLGEPISFPQAAPAAERRLAFNGLYDVCLALTLKQKIVANTAQADGKDLVIITGANQGGKSTFLRSIGVAQLMMQCGMFAPADSFCASVCDGVFTHYKREEDTTMKSGKLDEELGRMSGIVDCLRPNAMVLFNESFAATNEREGSEIARQIVSALLERRIRVFYVTHLYNLAHSFYARQLSNALFLRADRRPDGTRTFKLIEGEPLQTSFGQDLYEKLFGTG